MLRCHGSKISGPQQTVVLQMWHKKREKNGVYDFPVHDGTKR